MKKEPEKLLKSNGETIKTSWTGMRKTSKRNCNVFEKQVKSNGKALKRRLNEYVMYGKNAEKAMEGIGQVLKTQWSNTGKALKK